MATKLALVQHKRPDFYVTLIELPKECTPAFELQLRMDTAREFDMRDGEGEFLVLENGDVIDRRPIPFIR